MKGRGGMSNQLNYLALTSSGGRNGFFLPLWQKRSYINNLLRVILEIKRTTILFISWQLKTSVKTANREENLDIWL